MDISKVRELVKLVEESGIEELEVSHLDTTIRIQKSAGQVFGAPAMMPQAMAAAAPIPAAAALEAVPAAEADVTRGKWKDVRSPIVGTFYRSPSPTNPSFVNVGDHVAAGETLCIVEAMKVMNEIDAEFSGTIKEILVDDGMPVEAEGVLFLVDPD
ncbi:MAG: acetyl-CoA carboxylase biotin carboxyl carrier protein [Candidatus Krumholzibacteria bacterium]|nr:acetyl-CoA carboxylase biotin carboxyl carrier protein [Candidatus Krumholzibacteria bacterium]